MCYTSGTTGDPKGVFVFRNRSNVLHALMANTGDSLGANAADTMLPVVPLFHANSWGIAFSAPLNGHQAGDARRQARRAHRSMNCSPPRRWTHTAGRPRRCG